MSYFNIIASTNANIVVPKYIPESIYTDTNQNELEQA